MPLIEPGTILAYVNNGGNITCSIFYASDPDAVVTRIGPDGNVIDPNDPNSPPSFPLDPFHTTVVLYADGNIKQYESHSADGSYINMLFADSSTPGETLAFGPGEVYAHGPLTYSHLISSQGYEVTKTFENGHLTDYTFEFNDLSLAGQFDANAGTSTVSLTNPDHTSPVVINELGNIDKLLVLNSASVVANDGAGLVGQDGASLVGQDGASLIGNDGASLNLLQISSLIGNDGASLIGNDGASLIGQDAAGIFSGAHFIDDQGIVANTLGSSLVGNDGAGFIANFMAHASTGALHYQLTSFSPDTLPAEFDLATLDGENGFAVTGDGEITKSGWSVASAGDVNGDGFDDVIIGAIDESGLAGASYVVFGKGYGFSNLLLSELSGPNGFRIAGEAGHDESGWSVASAGDVNDDGFDDLIIGARQGFSKGAAYVVLGKASGWSSGLDLGSLDGTNGFKLSGENDFDLAGASVSSAGDINGDGFDDVIVAAPGADNSVGASYVVFGKDTSVTPFTANIDLSSLDGTNGFRIGGAVGDSFGYGQVAGIGDFNGDHIDDLVVGVPGANTGVDFSGATYVLFGSDQPFDADIDRTALDGTDGFRLVGAAFDSGGVSVAAAGDVNGDGFKDLIIGAPGANGTGAAYIVFGTDEAQAATFDLANLDGTNGFKITGTGTLRSTGIVVSSAGDVNGDGFNDLFLRADIDGTDFSRAYVVFGTDQGFAATLDLSSIDGINGFLLEGDDAYFDSLASAGDVNGDDYDDLILGYSSYALSTGRSYIVFGGPSLTSANAAPVGNDDARWVDEYVTVSGNVIADGGVGDVADTDADDDPLTIVAVDGGTVGQALAGTYGTLTLNQGGGYTYVADRAEPLAVGAVVQDVFTYTVTDGSESDTATLTISVTGVATGNGAANYLLGNSGGNTLKGLGGSDTLDGAAGKDVLVGGRGKDRLIGGSERDIFDFDSIADSVKGANRDVIVDFRRGNNIIGDDIDLSTIDAKTGVKGNQAFHFIGKQGFHHHKGELHYVKSGKNVIVQGDVNGDAKADFEILVMKTSALGAGDFLL